MAYMAVTRTRSGTEVIKRRFDVLRETFLSAKGERCPLCFVFFAFDVVLNVENEQVVLHDNNTWSNYSVSL